MKHNGTLNKTGVTRAIVMTDVHVPFEDTKSLKAIERYMATQKFDYYLNLGDLMDFDMISSFNAMFLRKLENRRIYKDYERANKILDRHQNIIRENNPKAKFVLLEGNHSYRVERYLDKMPSMIGLIEVERCLKLKERGMEWIRSWSKGEIFTLGKANFSHGDAVNQHHAKKMVEVYDDNIFYGHVHDCNSFSKQRRGKDKTIIGQSLGCLCKYEQDYLHGRATNWQQAFAVFEFSPDGHFNYHIYRLFNNRFIADGKIWK